MWIIKRAKELRRYAAPKYISSNRVGLYLVPNRTNKMKEKWLWVLDHEILPIMRSQMCLHDHMLCFVKFLIGIENMEKLAKYGTTANLLHLL